MTTMTAISATTTSYGLRIAAPVHRGITARRADPATAAALQRATGAAMRFGLALVPFSALTAMFVWL